MLASVASVGGGSGRERGRERERESLGAAAAETQGGDGETASVHTWEVSRTLGTTEKLLGWLLALIVHPEKLLGVSKCSGHLPSVH